jgi:hypothetical protein
VANDEDMEPVPAPHRREGPRGRLRVAARPKAKVVVVGDPVQAVVRVRLAPAASRRGIEQCVRALGCVRCARQVTGDVDYELLVTCRAIADLDSLLACLRGCDGTEVTTAALVLREVAGPRVGAAGDGRLR